VRLWRRLGRVKATHARARGHSFLCSVERSNEEQALLPFYAALLAERAVLETETAVT
jgi:hypothetical protein